MRKVSNIFLVLSKITASTKELIHVGYLTLVWLPNPFCNLLSSEVLAVLFYFLPTQSEPELLHLFFKAYNFLCVCRYN